MLEFKEHTVEVTNVKEENQSQLAIQIEYVKIFRELNNSDCYKEINVESNDITTTNEINKIQYSENHNWAEGIGSIEDYSGGNDYWTSTKGAYYTIKFKGRSIKILGKKASDFGQYDVYMDDEKIDTIQAQNNDKLLKQVLFEKSFDQTEEHVFKVIKEGNGVIEVDNIIVGTDEYIAVDEIQVYPNNVEIGVNQTQKIFPTILPNDSTTNTVQFRSLNSNIAKVNMDGVVKGVSVGKTEIEVICGGLVTKVPVNVKQEKDIMGTSFAYTGTHTLDQDYQKTKLLNDKNENLVAWKNDEVHAKAIIWSYDQPLNNIKVSSSDLVGEQGSIKKEFIDVNFLTEVSAYVGKGNAANKPHENIPEVIDYKDSVNLDPESSIGAWLSINTPTDVKAGIYNGTLTITSDEKTEELKYSLEILDIVYPETKDYTMLELWQYPFSAARYYESVGKNNYFSDQHINILKEQLQLYANAGGTAITTSILEEPWGHQTYDDYPSMVRWKKTESGVFDFDYTWFDKYVELCMELGIDKQIKSFSMVPWSNKIVYFDEKSNQNKNIQIFKTENGSWTGQMTDEGKAAWDTFLDSYIKHLDEKGWFDITYIAMDERPMQSMETAIQLIKSHKNKDGKSLKISGCFNHYGSGAYEEILENTDDVSIGMTAINGEEGMEQFRKWALDRKEKGLLTSIYTCTTHYPNSFTRSNPDEAEWVLWFVESMNADGFLRWAYDAFLKDPYDNIDAGYEAGDEFFIYPDPDQSSENPVTRSTVRFEMMEEGIHNIVKYRYLMENADEKIVKKLKSGVTEFQRIKGTTVEGGAEGTTESKSEVTAQVKEMDETLSECTQLYIIQRNVEISREELRKELENAEILLEQAIEGEQPGNYPKEAILTFEEVLVKIKEEMNEVLSLNEIKSLKNELKIAETNFKNSVVVVHKNLLEMTIQKAESLVKSEYTVESWKRLEIALSDAVEVYRDDNATQEIVDNAKEALDDAILSLKKVDVPDQVNKLALYELLKTYEGYHSSDYTESSWKLFKEAYDGAYKVYLDENATQEEVTEAYELLQKAALNLKNAIDNPNEDATEGEPIQQPDKDTTDTAASGLNTLPWTAAGILSLMSMYMIYRKKEKNDNDF